jgi:hypothetical protein
VFQNKNYPGLNLSLEDIEQIANPIAMGSLEMPFHWELFDNPTQLTGGLIGAFATSWFFVYAGSRFKNHKLCPLKLRGNNRTTCHGFLKSISESGATS